MFEASACFPENQETTYKLIGCHMVGSLGFGWVKGGFRVDSISFWSKHNRISQVRRSAQLTKAGGRPQLCSKRKQPLRAGLPSLPPSLPSFLAVAMTIEKCLTYV